MDQFMKTFQNRAIAQNMHFWNVFRNCSLNINYENNNFIAVPSFQHQRLCVLFFFWFFFSFFNYFSGSFLDLEASASSVVITAVLKMSAWLTSCLHLHVVYTEHNQKTTMGLLLQFWELCPPY